MAGDKKTIDDIFSDDLATLSRAPAALDLLTDKVVLAAAGCKSGGGGGEGKDGGEGEGGDKGGDGGKDKGTKISPRLKKILSRWQKGRGGKGQEAGGDDGVKESGLRSRALDQGFRDWLQERAEADVVRDLGAAEKTAGVAGPTPRTTAEFEAQVAAMRQAGMKSEAAKLLSKVRRNQFAKGVAGTVGVAGLAYGGHRLGKYLDSRKRRRAMADSGVFDPRDGLKQASSMDTTSSTKRGLVSLAIGLNRRR